MGKLGLLAFAGAAIAILNAVDVLSKWHGAIKIAAYGMLGVFGGILFLFDLIRFVHSPYPLRTKIVDVVLSTILGDYFEENRCWFNWKANLYGNQFFAKEVLFDKWSYPVLCVLDSTDQAGEDSMPINIDKRNFVPGAVITRRVDNTWHMTRSGLEDAWDDHSLDFHSSEHFNRIRFGDIGKVCFRFFTIGDCYIKLKVLIKSVTEYKCIIQMYFGGNANPFAQHTEYLTESGNVQTLFDFFDACQQSPKTGIIDIRKGGVQGRKRVIHSFRIEDALTMLKDKPCALFECHHVDHGLWVL